MRSEAKPLRIFFNDPVLPANGHEGRNWRDDFQLTLHIQDDVRVVRDTGNLFLERTLVPADGARQGEIRLDEWRAQVASLAGRPPRQEFVITH